MKVRGLFGSLEARGKFGDIMVGFPWKGIQVVRVLKYPAQPRTPAQVSQRVHMAAAILEWKQAQYTVDDQAAWVKFASIKPKPETGPNQMTRKFIEVVRRPAVWSRLRNIGNAIDPPHDRRVAIEGDAGLANVKVRFGTNIRFMNTIGVALWDAPSGSWYYHIPAGTFNSGDRVYFFFADGPGAPETWLGTTGISYFDMP